MFGESTAEVIERARRGDVGEEAVQVGARKMGTAPSEKEVEERNLDHAAFWSWCLRRVNGRAELLGHVEKCKVKERCRP